MIKNIDLVSSNGVILLNIDMNSVASKPDEITIYTMIPNLSINGFFKVEDLKTFANSILESIKQRESSDIENNCCGGCECNTTGIIEEELPIKEKEINRYDTPVTC